VDRPSNGLLQDVHWSIGLFGYFPTYSLGNVYAGCLHAALRRDVPDLDSHLGQGDTDARRPRGCTRRSSVTAACARRATRLSMRSAGRPPRARCWTIWKRNSRRSTGFDGAS
jgi:hypothetical protein